LFLVHHNRIISESVAEASHPNFHKMPVSFKPVWFGVYRYRWFWHCWQ